MMTLLRALLVFVAVSYVGVVLFMYVQQRSLQYFPGRAGTSPQALGLAGVTQEQVRTSDGETIVLWHATPAPGMPTILFFHGNGGELADRRERLAYYQSRGFGALFVSYRGYGASTGAISEAGFMADALAAYDWLRLQGVPPGRIMLVGESLGTGVAVQLAALRPVAAVALEAPYTAAVDVAAAIYWWIPVRLLMKDQFRSRDHIARVKVPLLIQHGDADGLIPVAQGKALFAMANEPKQLVVIPGAGHDVIGSPDLWAREADFFMDVMKAQ